MKPTLLPTWAMPLSEAQPVLQQLQCRDLWASAASSSCRSLCPAQRVAETRESSVLLARTGSVLAYVEFCASGCQVQRFIGEALVSPASASPGPWLSLSGAALHLLLNHIYYPLRWILKEPRGASSPHSVLAHALQAHMSLTRVIRWILELYGMQ